MRKKDKIELKKLLNHIDGRGYKAYKDIKGIYDFGSFILIIDHVQSDPFAPPSLIQVRVNQKDASFPKDLISNKSRKVAFSDFLVREIYKKISLFSKGRRGTGKSGLITIDKGGQEIIERTAVIIEEDFIEARLGIGLPAFGRKISAKDAYAIFFEELPKIIKNSLFSNMIDLKRLSDHVNISEDQDFLRNKLSNLNLVAFIGENSILPRRSGIDDRPMEKNVIPFLPPLELMVEVVLSHQGKIRGMGIPKGVTLIVGGGFHGKSTLLNAIQKGIYNHIPNDGREFVVTDKNAVKIRAEDGRYIEKVNISPFISNLPFNKPTNRFSTQNASGSTSQAANIIEAIEMGTSLLLIDEDSSATNFMVRDKRMQELVKKEKEPITPFIDKVKTLYKDYGVSTILVMGGSGDYFDVADEVILMDHYKPIRVTDKAKKIAKNFPIHRKNEGGEVFGKIDYRTPKLESFHPKRGKKEVKIDAKGLSHIIFGITDIDLSYVEQLVDPSQTKAIGWIIYRYAKFLKKEKKSLKDGISEIMHEIDEKGLDILMPYKAGNLAKPRIFEVAAAINRMRTLKVE